MPRARPNEETGRFRAEAPVQEGDERLRELGRLLDQTDCQERQDTERALGIPF